ncbi:MAG: SDR family oxidoreductase [Pseudohongiellaceae bacterium]|nr:SDR family oxidoreductase [Pseudohongiellaceae bacterium]
MQLKDKTLVLTGATGGIGSALAAELAQEGAHLILVGRDQSKLNMLRSSLKHCQKAHLIYVADISEQKQRDDLVAYCLQLGIDGLINNAGLSHFGLLQDTPDATISALVQMNLEVPMLLTKAFLPVLTSAEQGLLVNIGSAFGSIGYPGYSIYCGSKFGLRGFTEAVRRECADSNLKVLHIAPRSTHTAINSSAVFAMNKELGNTVDMPELVASQIVRRIKADKWGSCVLGWPEKLYAIVNSILPGLTDQSIKKVLAKIKRFTLDKNVGN